MIKLYIKEGWQLNPNDKVVSSIIKRVEKNNGNCPCKSEARDKKCPCSDYREEDNCHCTLYIKKE